MKLYVGNPTVNVLGITHTFKIFQFLNITHIFIFCFTLFCEMEVSLCSQAGLKFVGSSDAPVSTSKV